MILQALYEYYNRSSDIAPLGREFKELPFLVVINEEGDFIRIEDTRNNDGNGAKYLVAKSWGRTGTTPQPFHFWDNCSFVFGLSAANVSIDKDDIEEEKLAKLQKEIAKNQKNHAAFISYVNQMLKSHPDNKDVRAVALFYEKNDRHLEALLRENDKWDILKKNLTKNISFLINEEKEIIAAKDEIIGYSIHESLEKGDSICLITGNKCVPITTFSKIKMGNYSDTKLVSFQKGCGYDSYGKEQGLNATMSEDAEFKCATALKKLLAYKSGNNFSFGNRTFVFWASKRSDEEQMESVFDLFVFNTVDDPNRGVENVRKTLESIYSGRKKTNQDGWFYIMGIYPANKARIAVSYWAELPLWKFAGFLLSHITDMEIIQKNTFENIYGLTNILKAVTFEQKIHGEKSNLQPNLPEAIVKSIIQGLPYPQSLFSSCIRRIRAGSSKKEDPVTTTRAAILKAYLNRINNNHKISKAMDKDNTNQGYLCGRLFAVLNRIQEKANKQHTIRERYMNSASSTPAAVFPTILNLSNHHLEKLESGAVFFEKLKQEIISKIDADGFKAQLDLQDQGRFFVGYYHQMQSFYTKNEEEQVTE